MILSIESNLPGFKKMEFRPGLNVLLADRNVFSTEKQTRNSAGKSSLIEIVHFLLGADVTKDTPFISESLQNASFKGRFRISGAIVHVERSVRQKDRVFLKFDGSPRTFPVQQIDLVESFATINDWNLWLGHEMFDLPIDKFGTVFEKGGPTFRGLFPYFARRRSSHAFATPSKSANMISDNAASTALSYLFGLDWTIVRDFEIAKQEKKEIDAEARNAVRVNPKLNTLASVNSEYLMTEGHVNSLRTQIENFRVEDHYTDLVNEASDAQIEAEQLSREALKYKTRIKYIMASIENEKVSSIEDVRRLYDSVGIQLPDSARNGFEKVEAFHESVIANRKLHLSQELERNKENLNSIEREILAHTRRRSEILASLKGKGAFSEFVDIQRRLANEEQKLSSLLAQRNALQKAENSKSELKKEKINLKQRLDADLAVRESAVREAVLAVGEALNFLYETDREKFLRIESTESGPRFNVHVAGSRSGGIANMEIFALDYGLFKVATRRFGGPRFLMHDSHLFDGVDSRQVATALEIGNNAAKEVGGQYIVTMNSDIYNELPFSSNFNPDEFTLPVVLDDTETGGIFGFRFD